MMKRPCVLTIGLFLWIQVTSSSKWPISELTHVRGHYPHSYCKFSNAILNTTDGKIYLNNFKDDMGFCRDKYLDIWDYHVVENLKDVKCDEVFDKGYLFTFFYWYGKSNNYHLTYDLLIPMYLELYYKKDSVDLSKSAFFPTVEATRLQHVQWDTDAFKNEDRYWIHMMKFMSSNSNIFPLDQRLRQSNKVFCFKMLQAGTPKADYTDEALIKAYVKYVKETLQVDTNMWKREKKPRVAVVSRSNRRLVLNEVELVEALNEITPTDLLKFDGMSFREQVAVMSKYTVMAALNGAGLMNGIYLPTHGVILQMAPYQSKLNVEQYSKLLKSRGPYMEWWNTHEDLHVPVTKQVNENSPNTIVHIEEFKEVIRDALKLAEKERKKLNRIEL